MSNEVLVYRVMPYRFGPGWWVTKHEVPVNWFPSWARAINEARSRNAAEHQRTRR